jgi:hypothetical protein
MNFESIESIANAVLFEGYMLYPYRSSAIKNRQRWNFGTLYPRAFSEAQQPHERWSFGAQLLVEADESTQISARVRFVQLLLPVGDSREEWREGFPRFRTIEGLTIADLCVGVERDFDLSNLSEDERSTAPPAFNARPRIGRLKISAAKLGENLYKVDAGFCNESPAADLLSRTAAEDVAFTSAHLLLEAENGRFVSLLDPPGELRTAVQGCVQDGVFPVLVGKDGDRTRVLCSPIILYDYPQVAPESAGDFFDGTEMDEMLALRVLTLTDEEKAAIRAGDPHARAMLERTETLPAEQLLKVHGAVRGLRPVQPEYLEVDRLDPFAERPALESVHVFGAELHRGDRVRLWPQKKADILDMAMAGRVAIIEAIEQDLEDNVQLAVVLEDDPGRDLGMLRQAGHRFFYALNEVEPLQSEAL